MKAPESILKQYDYALPPELIANKPAVPRDSARILVYDKRLKKPVFNVFANIGKYLPKGAVLVFNRTKVWPARLIGKKQSGGKVELLYISRDDKHIKALSNRHLDVNRVVTISGTARFEVAKKVGQFYFFKPSFPITQTSAVLKKYGVTPLPPYIKNSPLTERQKRKQYQSIFAKSGLSVAAPTASLHFTERLMKNLRRQGIAVKFVRLDVGLGTFAPLRGENLKSGKLHREFYSINKSTAAFLNKAKRQGRPIIAVGTTVIRTLESASVSGNHPGIFGKDVYHKAKNIRGPESSHKLAKLSGNTDLFIREGYKFKFANGLITNFHVPQSSLLMLVSAFVGRDVILKLYDQAIKKRLCFFSFGDGMLLLP